MKSIPNFINDSNLRKQLFDSERKLNSIIDQEVKGIITRSRVQWVEEGERSKGFFFGLEKSNGKKKSINKLITAGRTVLYDQQEIYNHVVYFYQSLYRSNCPNIQNIDNYLQNTYFNTLDDFLSENLYDELSISEMDVVVGNLKNNKSPGWDGLTAEFYKEFWEILRPIPFKNFVESIEMDCMSPSQRIGIRFTHFIKNRIIKVLPSIISNIQSGFQSGKSTCDNLILVIHQNSDGSTAAVLRQYCGSTAAVPRQYGGSTAAVPRQYCGSTAAVLRQ